MLHYVFKIVKGQSDDQWFYRNSTRTVGFKPGITKKHVRYERNLRGEDSHTFNIAATKNDWPPAPLNAAHLSWNKSSVCIKDKRETIHSTPPKCAKCIRVLLLNRNS